MADIEEVGRKLPPWLWLAGGGLLLFLFLKGRSGGAVASTSDTQNQGIAEAFQAQEMTRNFQHESFLQGIEEQTATEQLNFNRASNAIQLNRLGAATKAETNYFNRLSSAKLQCPGKSTLALGPDGTPYCREKTSGFHPKVGKKTQGILGNVLSYFGVG